MAYVPHTDDEVRQMLEAIGKESLEALFSSIPAELRLKRPLQIPARAGEVEILRRFEALASRNRRLDEMPSFLGAGVYHRFVPAAVDYLSSRGEFNTAYTPYQPEVSQGTLQAVFEYQSLMARLTAMEISNASMYEAGTALAEAALMAYAIHGSGKRLLVSAGLHPEYRRVLETYFRRHPIVLETVPLNAGGILDLERLAALAKDGGAFAAVLQTPSFFGSIEDGPALRRALDALGEPRPLLIAAVDPISLGLLTPPGDYGADIAVGDGQSLGNEPNLGGPTFGFFATRMEHVRKIPGRIVGETKDRDGQRGYVLTFQTREQHIRRERATSNICTNQGLACLRGAMAMAFLGERGIRAVAEVSTRMAHHAERRLLALPGLRRVFAAPYFQEFVLELPRDAEEVYRELLARGVRGGLPLGRYFPERRRQMLFAATELTTRDDVEALCQALGKVLAGASTGGAGPKPQPRQPLEAIER
jgi:glycine dehydrogenase subunit 1